MTLYNLSLLVGGSVKQGKNGSHLRISDVRVYSRIDGKWDVWHRGTRLVMDTTDLEIWLA